MGTNRIDNFKLTFTFLLCRSNPLFYYPLILLRHRRLDFENIGILWDIYDVGLFKHVYGPVYFLICNILSLWMVYEPSSEYILGLEVFSNGTRKAVASGRFFLQDKKLGIFPFHSECCPSQKRCSYFNH